MKPMCRRANPDEETTNRRAVCGRTACTVRRAGRARALSDPYQLPSCGARHEGGWAKNPYNEAHGTNISIRQVKYLNNIVEQDHRGVKRVTRPMLGFKSFEAAQDTLVGIEFMHMIKKKQMVLEAGDEGLTAAELSYSLAA
jgi:hypothetical protein